ncbi:MAG TPA: hypothetical protein VGB74_09845, partial [Actinoplanes sp.]
MSDDRDETRQSAPSGDAARAQDPRNADIPPLRGGVDDTVAGGPSPTGGAETVAGGPSLTSGAETVAGAMPPVRGDDDTLTEPVPAVRAESVGARQRPDATAIIPPVTDDWAPSRGNPAWS